MLHKCSDGFDAQNVQGANGPSNVSRDPDLDASDPEEEYLPDSAEEDFPPAPSPPPSPGTVEDSRYVLGMSCLFDCV